MKSAVEWLENHIDKEINKYSRQPMDLNAIHALNYIKHYACKKAKEMEKQVNAEIRNNAIDNIIESFIDEFKSKIAPTMGVLIELDRLKDKYTNKEII